MPVAQHALTAPDPLRPVSTVTNQHTGAEDATRCRKRAATLAHTPLVREAHEVTFDTGLIPGLPADSQRDNDD